LEYALGDPVEVPSIPAVPAVPAGVTGMPEASGSGLAAGPASRAAGGGGAARRGGDGLRAVRLLADLGAAQGGRVLAQQGTRAIPRRRPRAGARAGQPWVRAVLRGRDRGRA